MAKKNETNSSFTKEQLYNSKKYEMQKDILGVMLEEDKEYTFDEVDNLIKEFLKREVE
jgi:hypothetical protein|nr:MAG TPA: hypothetical protein [Caudoviricetes sp.]DAI16751.1 MAG TPA: hypothetical protein [Caudoviricetes sp.]DAM32217.1 MAG TPA: hypothetical protein [Caudoviricetes sp.]DAO39482.1 MAG TPA: hypothetical protein [Caudoviricetes sp.]